MTEQEEPWWIPVKARYEFRQEKDSCDSGDDFQHLDVEIDDAGAGNFLWIKTKRWALDEDQIDRFCQLLKDCLKGNLGLRDYFNDDYQSVEQDREEVEE